MIRLHRVQCEGTWQTTAIHGLPRTTARESAPHRNKTGRATPPWVQRHADRKDTDHPTISFQSTILPRHHGRLLSTIGSGLARVVGLYMSRRDSNRLVVPVENPDVDTLTRQAGRMNWP